MKLLKLSFFFGWLLIPTASLAALYPPQPGTDRQSVEYLEAVEEYLEAFDLDDETLVFERLGGTTATNWAVKKNGEVVADLKCTSGNTDHHGAVIAYRLGRELGFNIYPVAVYRDVNRRINGKDLNQQCALKEWSTVFTQYYWTRETFSNTDNGDKKRLATALKCESPKPRSTTRFQYYARSAYGDPAIPGTSRVPYQGTTDLLTATKDFSKMMVIDTLIGNEDRFPGGNTFFRSVTMEFVNNQGNIVFEKVRLFSLDNEAAFKGHSPASTHSARDLKKYVWRFDAAMISNLRRLAGDPQALGRITDRNEDLAGFIRQGIQIAIEQYSEAESKCGQEMATF